MTGQGGEVTREELTGGWSRWRSYQSGTLRWPVKVEKLPEWNSQVTGQGGEVTRVDNSQVAGQGGEVTRVELSGDWSRWRSYQSGQLTGGWSRWRSYQSGTHRWLVKVEKLPEWNSQVAGQGGEVTRVDNSQVAGQGGEVTRVELTGGWSRWRSYQSGTLRWLVKVEKLPEWNSQVTGQGGEVTRVDNSQVVGQGGEVTRVEQVAGQGGEVTRVELTGGWSRWKSYQSGTLRWLVKVEKLPEWTPQSRGGEVGGRRVGRGASRSERNNSSQTKDHSENMTTAIETVTLALISMATS